MKRILVGLVLVFALSVQCYAVDITGTWKGRITEGGSGNVTMKLKQNNEKVTGTFITENTRGKIKGKVTDAIDEENSSYSAIFDFTGKFTYPCTGILKRGEAFISHDKNTMTGCTVYASYCDGSGNLVIGSFKKK